MPRPLNRNRTTLRARVLWPALAALSVVVGLQLFVAAQPRRSAPRADPSPRTQTSFESRVLAFVHPTLGVLRAVALVPRVRAAGERFPLLIALHGLGETRRGVERGALGWSQDYELGASDLALRDAPLAREDFFDLVSATRLRVLDRELRRQPYRGLVVVTPFTPDVRADLGGAAHEAYDRWLVETLLPRARTELPVFTDRAHTGIDGVSLGGLHALWTGLAHPEQFAAVGALQAAVRERIDPILARRRVANGLAAQRIRLVTSTHDVLRDDVEALGAAMRARRIAHELRVLEGPHDYVFNRGPGGLEMLLFHDRALRGEPCP